MDNDHVTHYNVLSSRFISVESVHLHSWSTDLGLPAADITFLLFCILYKSVIDTTLKNIYLAMDLYSALSYFN